jgi:hypothetical protein
VKGTEVVVEARVSEAGTLHCTPAGAFNEVQVKLTTPEKLEFVRVRLYAAV